MDRDVVSLRATTTEILRAVPGVWACCIVGLDGLTLEAQEAPSCPPEALAWVTEISAPLAALRRAADTGPGGRAAGPGPGSWSDLVVAWGACHLVASALGEAHFAALVLGPEGLSGQGRYVLGQHRAALMAALFPPR